MATVTYAKRPRRGDVIETGRYGDVTVLDVHNHGKVLDVQTRVHGVEHIERAEHGNWVVVQRASAT